MRLNPSPLCMLFQLAICVLPLCLGMPKRARKAARTLIALLALLLGIALGDCISGLRWGFATNLLSFVTILFTISLAVWLVLEGSPWQALFCCTAAWATQNLMSGTGSLLILLAEQYASLGFLRLWFWPLLFPTIPIYPLYLAFFVRPVRRHGLERVSDTSMVLMAFVVVLVVMGLDLALRSASIADMGFEPLVMARVAHGTVCVFVLYAEWKVLEARQLATDREVERRVAGERERQYQLSRQNIDAINMKCHDIKHQIHALGEDRSVSKGVLADIAHEVDVYDCVLETGNPALDTVLTEKSLVCAAEKIELDAIVDGALLGFMATADVYALFGNALDNAIEAVRRLGDASERVISLDVHRANDMALINLENRCAEEPAFEGGLPLSTKGDPDSHGFGTRSMRGIVQKYDGALHLGCEDGVFHVTAFLPLPE